jgi:hypothetical protein
MKPIAASLALLLAAAAPALAQNTERNVSVPDAVPACMERNGPDCVLKSDVVAPRAAAGLGVVPPATPVTPPVEVVPPGTVGIAPAAPPAGLVGGSAAANVPSQTVTTPSGTTVVVTPNANSTSSGFTTNPNSIGGNLQSSGGTTGTSTSSGFTTNPNSIGGALNSGPASTPGTATTGAGSVRR